MKIPSQHSALQSLNQNLVPAAHLIDARSELDQLNFLTEYAALINFYDGYASPGNWQPFLLKDPVFLTAHIVSTPLAKMQTAYQALCSEISRAINSGIRSVALGDSFNRLFDHVTDLFKRIAQWSGYMINSPEDYTLKRYLLGQTMTKLSVMFWATVSLRDSLSLNGLVGAVKTAEIPSASAFDQLEWTQNKGKLPFWEVLHLKSTIALNTPADFFSALKKMGDTIYSFLDDLIKKSKQEYELRKKDQTRYADTLLLRTTLDLLAIHREQLNGLASKHLEFYYKKILLQSEQTAKADHVFVCGELASPTMPFILPASTLLNGGVDASNRPVVFETMKATCLNPGKIVRVQTIAASVISGASDAIAAQSESNRLNLVLDEQKNTASVQKNDAGEVIGWQTFGAGPTAQIQKMGLAFGTPMLLLREGLRMIHLTLTYQGDLTNEMLASAHFFLSTQKAWLDVTNLIQVSPITDGEPVKLTLTLNETQPPIEAFAKNPDGYDCEWPMFKVLFSEFSNLQDVPSVLSLQIDVEVSGVKTLQLSNDYGVLNANAPFQPFGPTPLKGSNLIIGSNEIFSKPVNAMGLQINWDKLPADFTTYYQQYNYFFANPVIPAIPQGPGIIKGIINLVKKTVRMIKAIGYFLKYKKKLPYVSTINAPFNNLCFTVDFSLLVDGQWKKVPVQKDASIVVDPTDPSLVNITAYQQDKACELLPPDSGIQLFNTDGINCKLVDTSYFSFDDAVINSAAQSDADQEGVDAAIQLHPSTYTAASRSGFLRISLVNPDEGFGSAIYPDVVSYVAMKNATIISNQKKDPKEKLLPAPGVPFAPKVKSMNLTHYKASATYNFSYQPGGYPIECFHYNPFTSYRVYSNTADQQTYWSGIGAAVAGDRQLSAGVAFYPCFAYQGALLLEVQNLVFPETVSLYFELANSVSAGTAPGKLDAFYLGEQGWASMPVSYDGTNGLRCSGIIDLPIDKEISKDHFLVPGKNYWIAICTTDPISDFPETVFLSMNGIQAKRSGIEFLNDTTKPQLAAGVIQKTQLAVPQILSLMQPFTSFGGKGAEQIQTMNLRVADQMKTKNRSLSKEDIVRLVKREFHSISYLEIENAPRVNNQRQVDVFVARSVNSIATPGAFSPLATACDRINVQNYLQKRTSGLVAVNVSNFKLQTIQVSADIFLKPGYETFGVTASANQSLKLYLSPWIESDTKQIEFGEPITATGVQHFLKTVPGILAVQNVELFIYELVNGKRNPISQSSLLVPPTNGILFVTSAQHQLNVKNP